ncbi:MAG: tetratricopeptide repeat protein [Polyangiaceae bacterium]
MQSNLSRAALSLFLSIGTGALAAPVWAADPAPRSAEDASEHYRRGLTFFRDKNYTAALAEFRRAYEISPNPQVLYNLGQIQMSLHDAAGALKSYQRYLQDGGDSVPNDRRAEVESAIASLKGRVAQIAIRTNAPTGDIAIDDEIVAHLPLQGPVLVTAGRRHVTLIRSGQEVISRWVELAAEDCPVIELTIQTDHAPAPPAAPGAAPRAQAAAPVGQPFVPVWLAWTTVGALATGTTVTGVLALGQSSSLAKDRMIPGVSRSTLDGAQSQTRTLALVTDILGAVTVIAAGAATYLSLWGRTDDAHAAGAVIAISPNGVTLSGRF